MRKVFVDLEMNPIRRIILPSGRIMKQEVIEIGAVAMNEDGEIIGKYSEYVRPVHNDRIDPFITQLTLHASEPRQALLEETQEVLSASISSTKWRW